MKHRGMLAVWLCVSSAIGYGIGVWQQKTMVWTADQRLEERITTQRDSHDPVGDLPVHPTPEDVAAEPLGTHSGIRFQHAKDIGLDFSYDNGAAEHFHLAETLGGGVGVIDFDLDGWPDLIFPDGGNPVAVQAGSINRIQLFRSQAGQKFSAEADSAAIFWPHYSHGCAVTDVNSDGFDDFLVTGYQSSVLYLNQGDGTFRRSLALDQATAGRWCATAAFSDLDHDGDPDVYVTCYTDTPPTLPTPVCRSGEQRIHCHPHFYNGVADLLLENRGDGTFVDRSQSSGVADFLEYGLGVVIEDLDNDGTAEIFVANDGDRNLLFRKTGPWQYEEIAERSGLAFNGLGETMGSMGIACADFDRNGWLDLVTTNFIRERNVIFSNLGALTFVDESLGTDLDRTSRDTVGWAAISIDADLDGWQDLFVANGHVSEIPAEPWSQRPVFLRGTDQGIQVERTCGDYFSAAWHGRGACKADVDNDGRDDIVVSHIGAPAAVLFNRSLAVAHSCSLRLIGRQAVRSGENARIRLLFGASDNVVPSGRNAGYLSSNSAVITLSLPDADEQTVRVNWADGDMQQFSVRSGLRLIVVEGREPMDIPL